MQYVEFWDVESASNPERAHRVSRCDDGSFACSCVQWTRHVPRRNCRHIWDVLAGHGKPVDPLVRAIELANRKQQKSMAQKETNERTDANSDA